MSTNNRISDLISSQLPQFVRDDHEGFKRFLELYYEYLEQNITTLNQGRVIERAKNLLTYRDIDQTLDDFAEKFYDEFLKFLPKNPLANRHILIKHIKDFYRAKGSEKSLRFLLRILFNEEAEIYYPKKDILKASDGKWFVQKSLRITNFEVDDISNTSISLLINKQINSNTTNTSATVERVDKYFDAGILIDELIITQIVGDFDNGEQITAMYTDENHVDHTITADIFGGIINTVSIIDAGLNYQVGDPLIINSDTGSGANVIVSRVSTGNINSILVYNGGAGYKMGDQLLITGGGGSGANAYVDSVDLTERIHANSYIIDSSLIAVEGNTIIANTLYSNLHSSNANTVLAAAIYDFVYAPTGPIQSITIVDGGNDYATLPDISVIANTTVKSLGILGRMNVVSAGTQYRIGNIIEFVSIYGFGANAVVSNVNTANANSITAVQFVANGSNLMPIGGYGYKQELLPTTNVRTTTGSGANITVEAILTEGADLRGATSSIGAIEDVSIVNRGFNYNEPPTIDLTQSGDGLANATATVIAGSFSYPGRYLNDDGQVSAYNFLQNRDYYQNYSYVIKLKESLINYKKAVKSLIHPSGLKFFGEYILLDDNILEVAATSPNVPYVITYNHGTYIYNNVSNVITVTKTSHGIGANTRVYLEFDTTTLPNGNFNVITSASNTFNVKRRQNTTANISGNIYIGKIISS